jgi:hypothetical protein
MTLFVFHLLAFFVTSALSVRMDSSVFGDLIGALIQLDIIVESPSTLADWNEMVRLNVSEPPECPFANHIFSCDKDGSLVEANFTAPPLASPFLARRLELGTFANEFDTNVVAKIRLRNYVGVLFVSTMIRHLEVRDSILVNASRPVCNTDFNDCTFLATFRIFLPSTFILSNVIIHDDNRFRPSNDNVQVRTDHTCRFQNVSMACPIPKWLAQCFNVSDAAMAPCITPVVNASSAFVSVGARCTRAICRLQCTPSPLEMYDCTDSDSSSSRGFFPSTPGISTIEFALRYVGVAFSLTTSFKTYGLVTRVELYDWRTFNWTIIEFSDTRTPWNGIPTTSTEIMLPPC